MTANPRFGFWELRRCRWSTMEPTAPSTTRGGVGKTPADESPGRKRDGGACSFLSAQWQCRWVFPPPAWGFYTQARFPPGSRTICTRQMSGSSLDIYKPVIVRCPPSLFFFTSPVTRDLPLVHLCILPSNLRDLKRDGPSQPLPCRLLRYPRRFTIRSCVDSD